MSETYCTVKDCACQHHDTVPRFDTTLTARDMAVVTGVLGLDRQPSKPLFGKAAPIPGSYRFSRFMQDRTEHGFVLNGEETIEETVYHKIREDQR